MMPGIPSLFGNAGIDDNQATRAREPNGASVRRHRMRLDSAKTGMPVRVRIHRGAHEIGGSCVEVESADGERLVLDIGAPLVTVEGEEPELPAVEGLIDADLALK